MLLVSVDVLFEAGFFTDAVFYQVFLFELGPCCKGSSDIYYLYKDP